MFTFLKLGAIRMRTWGIASWMGRGFYRWRCWRNGFCRGCRCRDCGTCEEPNCEKQERRDGT